MIAMYGIKNCDTIKKARAWMDAQGLTDWRRLKQEALRSYVAGAHRRGLSGKSLQRRLSAVRSFYRHLNRSESSELNPALGLRAPTRTLQPCCALAASVWMATGLWRSASICARKRADCLEAPPACSAFNRSAHMRRMPRRTSPSGSQPRSAHPSNPGAA